MPALLVPKLKGRLSTGTHDITPPVRNAWAYTVQCRVESGLEFGYRYDKREKVGAHF